MLTVAVENAFELNDRAREKRILLSVTSEAEKRSWVSLLKEHIREYQMRSIRRKNHGLCPFSSQLYISVSCTSLSSVLFPLTTVERAALPQLKLHSRQTSDGTEEFSAFKAASPREKGSQRSGTWTNNFGIVGGIVSPF